MPQVIQLGIGYEEFWGLNPRIISILVKAQHEKTKNEILRQNMLMHIQGHYVAEALLCTVGNMFSKGKKFEYPKEPYNLNLDIDVDDEFDRKIAIERKNFVNQLNSLFGDIERTLEDKNAEH